MCVCVLVGATRIKLHATKVASTLSLSLHLLSYYNRCERIYYKPTPLQDCIQDANNILYDDSLLLICCFVTLVHFCVCVCVLNSFEALHSLNWYDTLCKRWLKIYIWIWKEIFKIKWKYWDESHWNVDWIKWELSSSFKRIYRIVFIKKHSVIELNKRETNFYFPTRFLVFLTKYVLLFFSKKKQLKTCSYFRTGTLWNIK